ncbi:TM1812 family CRISPR-associated protein [Streptobacillus canis]|uniref:TM1812 family CRISPR-associated protein n=1 Tax=Streptobacillus canis TaxID=2678686 RepID=UPI0012E269C2|nr:TM1812 family CRISPR-associated protein [Streptobacillus canis]
MGDKKLLIITLTKGIWDKLDFEYRLFENDKEVEIKDYSYFIELYINKYKFDEIICIGTEASSWDYLYNILNKTRNQEEYDWGNIKNEEELNEILNKNTDIKINSVILSSNANKSVRNKIFNLKDKIKEFDDIYIDFSGFPRNLSLDILMIINNMIYSMKGKRKFNFFMQYSDVPNKKSDIFLDNRILNNLVEINNLSSFLNYGDTENLEYMFEEEEAINKFKKMYLAQQFNLVEDFNNTYFSLIKVDKKFEIAKKNKVVNKMFELYSYQYPEIEKLRGNSSPNKKDWENNLIAMSSVNLSRKNLGIAINNIHDMNDNNISKLKKILKNINNSRNQILHAFTYKKSKKSKKRKDYNSILEIYKSFRVLQGQNDKKDVSNVLIWNLGDTDYYEVEYEYKNKKYKDNITLKILDCEEKGKKKYDTILIIGTKTSNWDFLISKLSNQININNTNKNYKEEDINKKLKTIDKRYNAVFIPEGKNNDEIDNIFEILCNKLIEILDIKDGKKYAKNKYKISYDITHSYRSTVYYVIVFFFYLELLFLNIELENITYAQCILNDKENENKKLSNLESRKNKILNCKTILDSLKTEKNKIDLEKYCKNNFDIKIKSEELNKFLTEIPKIFEINDYKSYELIYDRFLNYDNNIGNLKGLELQIYNILKDIIIGDENKDRMIHFIRKQFEFNNLLFVLYNLTDYYYYIIFENENNENEYEKNYDYCKKMSEYFAEDYPFIKEVNEIMFNKKNVRIVAGHNKEIKINNNLDLLKTDLNRLITLFEDNQDKIEGLKKRIGENKK